MVLGVSFPNESTFGRRVGDRIGGLVVGEGVGGAGGDAADQQTCGNGGHRQ
ncbi:hypothetical protein [Streptomyces sp. NPDC051662]|uniref:hypothetical protein n=1 Tax=Streptomyces sp. NPDC051662 TaxID=3154750 RepID=UPI003413D5D0